MDLENVKNTSQPLFILRRSQEIQEEAALESHLLRLDWEKAFDKVSQSRMVRAMRRLGVPENHQHEKGDLPRTKLRNHG